MAGIIYTNTTSKKRKQKKTSNQIKAEADHAAFLRSMGVSASHPKKEKKKTYKPTQVTEHSNATTLDSIKGIAPKRKENVYSGERKLIGIATMHKSNAVPVFEDNKELAKEIAQMRRN